MALICCNPTKKAKRTPTRNPADDDGRQAGISKFEEFHRFQPTKIGSFPHGFKIPTTMLRAGPAKWTIYRSGKVDPSTLIKPKRPVNYIHEHDAGVVVYLPTTRENQDLLDDADEHDVPLEFAGAEVLVKLGSCLGFAFEIDGEPQEVEGVAPLPELYCTHDGRCLFVIQDKREVLAAIWGGALGVFARGIDG